MLLQLYLVFAIPIPIITTFLDGSLPEHVDLNVELPGGYSTLVSLNVHTSSATESVEISNTTSEERTY